MIPLILVFLLLAALVYMGRPGGRPLAERLVDALYHLAALATAVAHSADSALCRYRLVRSEIRAGHRAQYAREAESNG